MRSKPFYSIIHFCTYTERNSIFFSLFFFVYLYIFTLYRTKGNLKFWFIGFLRNMQSKEKEWNWKLFRLIYKYVLMGRLFSRKNQARSISKLNVNKSFIFYSTPRLSSPYWAQDNFKYFHKVTTNSNNWKHQAVKLNELLCWSWVKSFDTLYLNYELTSALRSCPRLFIHHGRALS